jgi:hypothetical protein
MWMRRPQRDVAAVMAAVRNEVDDGDMATAKRRGDSPVRRAQRGHGSLGVQAGEWWPRLDGADVERNSPSHPPLFLWRIDAHASPGTELQDVPPAKAVLGRLLVAALGVPVWLAVPVKTALGWLHVAARSVPVWLDVHPSRGQSRWHASWLCSPFRTRWYLTSRSGTPF